jgi:NAD(P)-dependent dehydrogenase (short-subunit alcohol dehydrogenase family)
MGILDEKVALVRGASKGIGTDIAFSLAKEGAAVAVNYFSDRQGADRVVEQIKAAGGEAIAVQGSATSSEEIDWFFNQTQKQLGNIDVLVNHACVFALPFEDVNEKEFHRQFNTNVLGLLLWRKGRLHHQHWLGNNHSNLPRPQSSRKAEHCIVAKKRPKSKIWRRFVETHLERQNQLASGGNKSHIE